MQLSAKQVSQFQKKILNFYSENKRDFSWRETTDPYFILVSEIMLQQTQTSRVAEKYTKWTITFPTVNELAKAQFSKVLKLWQGLGYNRRAQFLHQSAKMIVAEFDGEVPNAIADLITLPGVGPNTAGAIIAYALNRRVVFIETNIRTVYLYEFFDDTIDVSDKEILSLVEQTLPKSNFRDWYYALTDYGVHLKKTIGNQNKRSKHYTKQSRFEGSKRQVRAKILKLLLQKPLSIEQLTTQLQPTDHNVQEIVDDLLAETLVSKIGNKLRIAS